MSGFVVSRVPGRSLRRVPVGFPGSVDRIRPRSGDPAGDRLAVNEARRVLYGTTSGRIVRSHVAERDRNCCRLCGIHVVWTDRRSPAGGVFHILDLERPVSAGNVVVACRRCNVLSVADRPPVRRLSLRRRLWAAVIGVMRDGR